MNEKTKVFTGATDDEFEELENKVNEWLSKNNVKITSRKVACAAGINELGKVFVNCTIAIFYTDKEVQA